MFGDLTAETTFAKDFSFLEEYRLVSGHCLTKCYADELRTENPKAPNNAKPMPTIFRTVNAGPPNM